MQNRFTYPSYTQFLHWPARALVFLSLSIAAFTVQGQELPQLNGYMYNQFLYNPASGGMYDTDFNFSAVSKFQTTGVDGAPFTSYAWADQRFRKNAMSAGLVLAYDRYGPRQFTDIAANYTYILQLNNQWKLSFGLRAGFTSLRNNVSDLKSWDSSDPLVTDYQMNYPKFGTGFQIYTRRFYAGLGVPDLAPINNNPNAPDNNKSFFQKNRNYVLLAGYRIKLNDTYSLYPNTKIYYYPGKPVRVDATLLFEISDYFWAGAAYATIGNASFSAGTFISSRIRFMYSYELVVRSLGGPSFNMHELNLMIQLDELFSGKNKKQDQ